MKELTQQHNNRGNNIERTDSEDNTEDGNTPINREYLIKQSGLRG
jgi:hypothetical protein